MKRISMRTLVIYAFAGLSGFTLLYTSQNVQQAENNLAQIDAAIQQEEEAIRVLNAEWAYLNSPARLETLASEYLKMSSPKPEQMVSSSSSLPEHAPPSDTEIILQEVSQEVPSQPQPPAASEIPPAIVPARKPAAPPQENFDQLLDKLQKEGAQ